MASDYSEFLDDLSTLLRKGSDSYRANQIETALAGGPTSVDSYLCSNELWGGAGSIADQSLLENKSLRSELERLLIKLGRAQINEGKINPRTTMWVEAFESLQKKAI
jgi:hypothetical protein